MRQSRTLDSGLAVPKDSSAVAYLAQAHGAEGTSRGAIGTRQGDLDQLSRKMPSTATPLLCVYEAGPCGAWLSRYRTQKGQSGWVVAPSLLPNKAGDRLNTARRDAVPRARLLRSGDLTAVDGPAGEDDALRARKTAQCRLTAFVLRHDIRSTGRAPWSPAHRRWLSEGVWATPAPQLVFQADVRALQEHTARLQRLEQARQAQVPSWRRQPVVEALEALRGGQGPVAVTVVAARGDLTRVEHPSQVMTYLGLSPSAYSRGERRQQGALTTAGTTQARRARGEGAWASR
jgi:transposase